MTVDPIAHAALALIEETSPSLEARLAARQAAACRARMEQLVEPASKAQRERLVDVLERNHFAEMVAECIVAEDG